MVSQQTCPNISFLILLYSVRFAILPLLMKTKGSKCYYFEMGERLENVRTIPSIDGYKKAFERIRGDYKGTEEMQGLIREVTAPESLQLLQNIFDRHLRKAGLKGAPSLQEVGIAPLDTARWKQFAGHDEKSTMVIDPNLDFTILINEEEITHRKEFINDWSRKIYFTHAIIHELSHYVAQHARYAESSPAGDTFVTRSGVRQTHQEGTLVTVRDGQQTLYLARNKKPVFLFTFLNEAITENLATEVLYEYAESSGLLSRQYVDDFYEARRHPREMMKGQIQRLIHLIAEHVAKDTGVGEDTVVEALRVAALTRFDLTGTDDSTPPVLDESMGEDFTKKLAIITTYARFRALIREYKMEPAFERWLNDAKHYLT